MYLKIRHHPNMRVIKKKKYQYITQIKTFIMATDIM